MGRPPSDIVKKYMTFYVEIDLCEDLEKYPNKTEIVNHALRVYLESDTEDIYRLERKLEEAKQTVNSLEHQLSKKRKEFQVKQELEQQQQSKHEKEIVENYHVCCGHINNTFDSAYLYSTKESVQEFNDRFGTCFTIKTLKPFITSVKSGKECLEVFKANLETTV